MHTHYWHRRLKGLFVRMAYACMVLVLLEGCQGCHRGAAVAPEPSEMDIETTTPSLGGIPNLGNTCYMNSVLQIIAKLYPDIFAGSADSLAQAGQVIVKKIRDDQDYVTREEADAFYTAFLAVTPFQRGAQESADECMENIWQQLGLPMIDAILGTPYITLVLQSSQGNKEDERTMSQLLDNYATVPQINPATVPRIDPKNFRGIIPIKLERNENGKTKNNTIVKQALQLTITNRHIPALPQDIHCRLVGFIVHDGSANRGHYFTYIHQNGEWKLYSDAWVRKVTPAQAEQAAEGAYLYFYSWDQVS